jgi:hypothetical protein
MALMTMKKTSATTATTGASASRFSLYRTPAIILDLIN